MDRINFAQAPVEEVSNKSLQSGTNLIPDKQSNNDG